MKKRYWIAILCAALALVLVVGAASADAGDVYDLATSASDLHDGDRIILVSDDGSYYQAMATDFSGMQITVTNNTVTEQNGMLVLTLTETDGGWQFASNDGYLAVNGGTLSIVADRADAAVWTISIASDGTATVSCTGGAIVFDEQDGAYRFLCGNGGNEIAIYNATFEPEHHAFGNGLWWSFADGKLTIGGTGAMPDFNYNSQPWNQYMNSITEVEIQDGVTSIGYYAFPTCTGLQTVTIGNGVTSIGNRAFYKCTGLTSITIGNGVTNIGMLAFYNCTGLTSITIPDSVTRIGDSAFSGCTGLSEIVIPDSVTSIGEGVFLGCTGLQSITIPDGVTSIGEDAFYGCTELTSITIPDSVTSIGKYAFYNCTGLTSITIPDGVKSISEYTFYGCTGLQSITIPDGVKSISEYAFYGCTGLQSITIGTSVTSVGDSAFFNTGWWNAQSDGIVYLDYILLGVKGACGQIVRIKAGTRVIADKALYNQSQISKVTIPDGMTSIGEYAFYGCTGLQSITIPDSVTSIGDSVFYGCTGLTSITIGNSVISVGNYAFYNCTGLRSVTIGNSVTGVGNYAFYNCTGLTSVTIPDSVTSIGYAAFAGCTGLQSITIGNGVTSIDSDAFNGCDSLTDVYYSGTETQRQNIAIKPNNLELEFATWHYLYANAMSKSLTLDGKIRVNFYVAVSADALADEGSYALVTFNGAETVQLVKDAPESVKDGVTRRQFTQDIVAKEMNDPVTLELFDGSGRRLALFDSDGTEVHGALAYCANDYVEAAMESSLGEPLKKLVEACANYGVAAQLQFGYEDEGLTIPEAVTAVTTANVAPYEAVYTGALPAGIERNTSSLLIESDNSIRQYFYLESGHSIDEFTFTVDGTVTQPKRAAEGKYYLEVTNIPAKDLDVPHTFAIIDGNETVLYSVAYSALSYAYKALTYSDELAPQTLKNMAKAIYLYNQAANAYFGN